MIAPPLELGQVGSIGETAAAMGQLAPRPATARAHPAARRSRARGQSMVEFALGAIVFVTILMFGIHFAEIGFLSQKAQQASATAIWDATSRRVTKIAPAPSKAPFDSIFSGSSAPAAKANVRYRDFDAVQNLSNRGITQVFTRATRPIVSCQKAENGDVVEKRIRFGPSATAKNVYFNIGGMTCSSQLTIRGIRIPRSFLDSAAGSRPFKEQHYKPVAIIICDVGRSKNGQCPGEHAILLGDWGLSNRATNENDDCPLTGCSNTGYYNAVRSMYPGGLGAGATAFATSWAGGAPASGSEFWMSYVGEESSYLQTVSGHPSGGSYNTGGTAQYTNGNKCFLGKTGNGC